VTEPIWIERWELDAMHAALIKHYGGASGVRAGGDDLIESAMARPQHKYTFEPDCSLAHLAAAYLYGLTKNHGFVDGNKRIGLAAASSFLKANGIRLTATQDEAYELVLGVVENRYTEQDAIRWIEKHSDRVDPL
jgi:death-on-curing protein